MPRVLIDLTGKRFGRWTVLRRQVSATKKKGTKWYCVCDCGTEGVRDGGDLRSGQTFSCGCKRVEDRTTHGLSKHDLYHVWGSIVQRCENEKSRQYESYGGRGIHICDSWRNNPEIFVKWCLANGWKKGLHIDRINNDKGYYPLNCRFVEQGTNNQNQRLLRKDNTSGFTGVNFLNGKYRANVSLNKQRFILGDFDTPEQAAIVRDKYLIDNNSEMKLNFPKLRKTNQKNGEHYADRD